MIDPMTLSAMGAAQPRPLPAAGRTVRAVGPARGRERAPREAGEPRRAQLPVARANTDSALGALAHQTSRVPGCESARDYTRDCPRLLARHTSRVHAAAAEETAAPAPAPAPAASTGGRGDNGCSGGGGVSARCGGGGGGGERGAGGDAGGDGGVDKPDNTPAPPPAPAARPAAWLPGAYPVSYSRGGREPEMGEMGRRRRLVRSPRVQRRCRGGARNTRGGRKGCGAAPRRGAKRAIEGRGRPRHHRPRRWRSRPSAESSARRDAAAAPARCGRRALGCAWLRLAALGCAWLRLAALRAERSGAELRRAAPSCAELRREAPNLCERRAAAPPPQTAAARAEGGEEQSRLQTCRGRVVDVSRACRGRVVDVSGPCEGSNPNPNPNPNPACGLSRVAETWCGAVRRSAVRGAARPAWRPRWRRGPPRHRPRVEVARGLFTAAHP